MEPARAGAMLRFLSLSVTSVDRLLATLVFGGVLGAYLAQPAQFQGNDTRPAVFAAVSLIKRGDFDLDEFASQLKGERTDWPYYVISTQTGKVISRFGIGAPLVAVPVFAPVLWVKGGRLSESEALVLGRLVAALCVAFAAALLFLCARRMGTTRTAALAVAALYGLGTAAFSIASQALWQHGPAQLFLALGLFCFTGTSRLAEVGGGAAFAAAVICRPADAVFAIAAAVAVVLTSRHAPRRVGRFFLGAVPLALVQLAYNHHYLGAPWMFGQMVRVSGQDALPDADYWDNDVLIGLMGLLVSPSRGLLVYTPAFVMVLYGLVRTFYQQPLFLRLQLAGAGVLVLIVANYYGWYGGFCFGYRMIADAAPALCLSSAPLVDALSGLRRVLYAVLIALSILVHAAGAYNYSIVDWDANPDIDRNRARLWSFTDSQLRYVLSHRRTALPP